MAEFAADKGMEAGDCLRDTGVAFAALSDPNATVTGTQELQLIRNLLRHFPDEPGLGLQVGSRYHFTSFGALGFALMSSPSVRSALDVALGYFPLTFAFTRFKVEDSATATRLVIDDAAVPMPLRRFLVERDSSALVTVQRDLIPDMSVLTSASFQFSAPEYAEMFEQYLGVLPEFDAPLNVAMLNRDVISLPLPLANALTQQAAIDQCRQLLDERIARTQLSAQVRERLARGAMHMPEMENVANEMCLTVRTLRRRLRDEGTSFIELRDEARCALAREWLRGSKLSVGQIGERLGYAEATSFINAFKRWTGETPHVFRRHTD
ncbi:MAG: AraC family transcriptional regulator [Alcanivoracaceae bacterium]|nr:AraC family transcriptional regulator [Alcanivoracaceae bacterium]